MSDHSGRILAGASFAAISGDATATAGGVLTLADPSKLYSVSKTLNATGASADGAIVGTSAGQLGHAAGVTLVAANATKAYVVERLIIYYTFATAAYTGGGN